jgi:hypothetical protein
MSILIARTRELLANRPRPLTYAHIAGDTGLTVRWLEAFAGGKMDDPSCAKVETLYEVLAGKKLDV